jgi:hypothetical protein
MGDVHLSSQVAVHRRDLIVSLNPHAPADQQRLDRHPPKNTAGHHLR